MLEKLDPFFSSLAIAIILMASVWFTILLKTYFQWLRSNKETSINDWFLFGLLLIVQLMGYVTALELIRTELIR